MKSRTEISAGGVVYRRDAQGEIEVVICKEADKDRWVLPKGLVDAGESAEQAALREVQEETGVRARYVSALGEPEKYVYTAREMRVFKTVHYFLFEYVSGSTDDHDHEMSEARWVKPDEALSLLAFKGAQDVLRRAVAALAGQTH
jgi:8-oxo-dGTP diphosphatase